jgi:hypothetical protein
MSFVWVPLGAVMGASVGMHGGGFVGAAAGMLAGCVELGILGVIFTLIGGRPDETIVGAVGGLLLGLAIGVRDGQAPVVLVANFGMVVGAIGGATLRAYVRLVSLPIIVLGQMLRRVMALVVSADSNLARRCDRVITVGVRPRTHLPEIAFCKDPSSSIATTTTPGPR